MDFSSILTAPTTTTKMNMVFSMYSRLRKEVDKDEIRL